LGFKTEQLTQASASAARVRGTFIEREVIRGA